MRKLLSTGLGCLLIGMAAVSGRPQADSQKPSTSVTVGDQFVGAWRLAWLERPGGNGKLHRIDCCGMLVFTPDRHMSVQVMEHDVQTQRGASGPEQYSQGGYEASYGRYEVDERAHTFTFHVEGALVPTLVGKDLPRAYEFSDRQLIVKSTRQDEHWRVAWERY
jgi:hypothetical protein